MRRLWRDMRRVLRERRGMTMVECMVAMVILAIAMAMLSSGLLTALAIVQRGADMQQSIERESLELEQSLAGGGGGSVTPATISINGQSISGRYLTVTDEETGHSFTYFVAD